MLCLSSKKWLIIGCTPGLHRFNGNNTGGHLEQHRRALPGLPGEPHILNRIWGGGWAWSAGPKGRFLP